METFAYYEERARDSTSRPLTSDDYYNARVAPKDHKRLDDCYSLGASYLSRHAARNWRAGNRMKAAFQGVLMPVAQSAAIVGTLMAWVPNFTAIAISQRFFPMAQRSELATRDDVMARSIFELSKVVNALAVEQQYHDQECLNPVSTDELGRMYVRTSALVSALAKFINHSEPRLKESDSLTTSLCYLDSMKYELGNRIERSSAPR